MCIACVPRTIASRSLVALDIETIDDVDRVVGLSGIGLGGVSAAEATSRRPAGRPGLSPREGQTLIAVALEHVRGEIETNSAAHLDLLARSAARGAALSMQARYGSCHFHLSHELFIRAPKRVMRLLLEDGLLLEYGLECAEVSL